MDAARKVAHGFVMKSYQETSATARRLMSAVDDDASVRESVPDSVREFGFAARTFSSADEFLLSDRVDQTRCPILNVFMPGISGPDLQREWKLSQ
jgi:FixJ family two-component response regulator